MNHYEYVNRHCKFDRAIQGRNEAAVKKTLCALVKLLHPAGDPTQAELEEYMEHLAHRGFCPGTRQTDQVFDTTQTPAAISNSCG